MDEATISAGGSDLELMRRTAAGDRDAFASIYRRHHAAIFRFARLMTGSDNTAEDVVQEAFLALMRDAGRYDASRGSISTYLYGIARHLTRRRLVRERRFVVLDGHGGIDVGTSSDPADRLDQQQQLERLRRAILALPSRFREVVVLCDLQDVSYADAAVTLACPLGTVRSRLHRARAMLARSMRDECVPSPAAERARPLRQHRTALELAPSSRTHRCVT